MQMKTSDTRELARKIDGSLWGRTFPIDIIVYTPDIIKDKLKRKDFKFHLEFLSRYYIETRYPGGFPMITLEEAEKAQKLAKEVKNFTIEEVSKRVKK